MSHRLELDRERLRTICNLEADEYNPSGRGLGCTVWTARIKPEVEAWIVENFSGTVEPKLRPCSANWDLEFEHDRERMWFKLVWY